MWATFFHDGTEIAVVDDFLLAAELRVKKRIRWPRRKDCLLIKSGNTFRLFNIFCVNGNNDL